MKYHRINKNHKKIKTFYNRYKKNWVKQIGYFLFPDFGMLFRFLLGMLFFAGLTGGPDWSVLLIS